MERRLDLGTALRLLTVAVHEPGVDAVPRPDAPRIVDRVLAYTGGGEAAVTATGDDDVGELYAAGRLPVACTLGALLVLRAAQQAEDRGRCGSDVLASATAAAIRALDLVPEPLFCSAGAR
jgi:hypothetical protein